MRVPTIHRNGTGSDSLLSDLEGAAQALTRAKRALEACQPNGRDYYPQGSEAFVEAQDEHRSRLERLNSVGLELTALVEGIADQVFEKERHD